jgi:hypothetical protein
MAYFDNWTDKQKQNLFNQFNPKEPFGVIGQQVADNNNGWTFKTLGDGTNGTNYSNIGKNDGLGQDGSLASKKLFDLSSLNDPYAVAKSYASGFQSNSNPYLTSLYDDSTYNKDLSMYDNPNESKPGGSESGIGSWFTGDKLRGYGAVMGGVGSLGSAWASLKNVGVAKQALAEQVAQWDRNYAAQRTTANNQIANQNAWKTAQGRSDMGTMIG